MKGNTVRIQLPSAEELIRTMGLDSNGRAQAFHTMNVNRRIRKYIPHLSGVLERNSYRTGKEIRFYSPYAKYQYYGMAMKGKAPKEVTGKSLQYTKDFNPLAGPYWDRALVAAEGEALAEDLQAYIDRRG